MTLDRPQGPQDRAAVTATAITEIIRGFVIVWFRTGKLDGLHAAIADYLRDEIHDIERQTISDIRPQDE